MPSYRNARAAEDIRRELSDIMRGLKDPRITGILSIVKLELSADYAHCKVFVSSMDGLEAAKTAVKGLQNGAGFIQHELNSRLRLRRTPELKFLADDGIAYSAELNRKLKDL